MLREIEKLEIRVEKTIHNKEEKLKRLLLLTTIVIYVHKNWTGIFVSKS